MNLFSGDGRIGRVGFVLRIVIGLLVMLLGIATPLIIGLLSVPWGIGGDEERIWSRASAEFVESTLGMIRPKLILLGFFLLGLYIWLCAARQRARDIGLELSLLDVPLHWANPFSRAHVGCLIASPGAKELGRKRDMDEDATSA
jgi:uncharacterized membrane protein YhaH (DUF805 family)